MNKAIFAFLACITILASCNQESTVGSDLLGNETINVSVDSINVTAVSSYDSPTITYRNSSFFDDQTYLLGGLDDPVFGKTTATLYLTPSLFSGEDFPIMRDLDSVVMSLPIDTTGVYGDTLEVVTVNVRQLIDPLNAEEIADTLRSDFCTIDAEMVPIGSVTRSINPRQTVPYINPDVGLDSTFQGVPQIRIPLESPVWQTIRKDTSIQNDEDLLDLIKGFQITTTGVNSMFGIDLRNSSSRSYLQWYYTDTAQVKQLYVMNVGALRHNCIVHDRSGSVVDGEIGNENSENNYIQAMGGVITEYDLADVLSLDQDQLINSAELEIFATNGTPEFEPADAVFAYYIGDDGEEVEIKDIRVTDLPSRLVFDGTIRSVVESGQMIQKYNLVITSHVIAILRGEISNTKIFIRIYPADSSNNNAGQQPNRTILYSPNHPEFPVTLKLILSNP